MASNFTKSVSPTTCIGDSLGTFNKNFENLDQGLSNLPTLVSSPSIKVEKEITEQGGNNLLLYKPPVSYVDRKFEILSNQAKEEFIILSNENNATARMAVTTFPYTTASNKPLAIDTFLCNGEGNPKITLYWTSSGAQAYNDYFFDTNNPSISGIFKPNLAATCVVVSDNTAYIGGEFTSVSNTSRNKFCAIDLYKGLSAADLKLNPTNKRYNTGMLNTASDINLGFRSDVTNFGLEGGINAIALHNNFLIFGGTFNVQGKGRGLTIIDKTNNLIHAFYVNGYVRDIKVINNKLYVAGKFNYINYGDESLDDITGLRIQCNGLVKIDLQALQDFSSLSIDKEFCKNHLLYFKDLNAVINKIEYILGNIYIGGLFELYENNKPTSINFLILSEDGKSKDYNCLIPGEIMSMYVDIENNNLYIGGNLKSFSLSNDFYSVPKKFNENNKVHNILCLSVLTPATPSFNTVWKPRINGPVTDLVVYSDTLDTRVYCTGNFTSVNERSVGYIAAIEKCASDQNKGDLFTDWRFFLDSPPMPYGRCLSFWQNSLVVVGTFNSINGQARTKLARLSLVDNPMIFSPIKDQLIEWKVNVDVCSFGKNLVFESQSDFVTTLDYPANLGVLHQTSLNVSPNIKKLNVGDLINFQIMRNSSSLEDSYKGNVYVVGWKFDFV